MVERVFDTYRAVVEPAYIAQEPQQDRLVGVHFYDLQPDSPKLMSATNTELELLPYLQSSRQADTLAAAEALKWKRSITEMRRTCLIGRNKDLNLPHNRKIEYLKKIACDLGIYAQGMLGVSRELTEFMNSVYDEVYVIQRENKPDIRIVALSARGQKDQKGGPVMRSGVLECKGLRFAPTELMGMYQSVGRSAEGTKYPELIHNGYYAQVRDRLVDRNVDCTYEMLCNEAARLKLLNLETIELIYERVQYAHSHTVHLDIHSVYPSRPKT